MTDSLGRQASRGGATTMAGQVARLVVYAISVLVLARLLTPADYGLLAMVVAVVGIAEILRDFGLSFAAVQAESVSPAERSNLFWASTALGLMCSVLVFGLSWPIASLYDQPSLVPITQVLSISFLVNGATAQLRTNLTRNLRFRTMATAEVVAAVGGLVVAVVVALLGGAYWALVLQQLVTQVLIMVYYLIAGRWFPGRYSRHVSIRSYIGHGSNLLGVQAMSYASRNVDSVVVGAFFGASATGVYNMAFQLMILPLNQLNAPITRVAFPVLSKLQKVPDRYSAFLHRGQLIMVYAICLVFGAAIPMAPLIVPLALGDQWGSAVPLFQILAIGGAAQAVSYATYWVFLSLGLSRSQLYWALASRPVVIAGVLIGAPWGPTGVAIGYSASLLLLWPAGILWVSRQSFVAGVDMFLTGLRAIVVAGLASGGTFAAITLTASLPTWITIMAGAAAYTLVLVLLWLVAPVIRRDAKDLVHTLRLLRAS